MLCFPVFEPMAFVMVVRPSYDRFLRGSSSSAICSALNEVKGVVGISVVL